MNSAHMIDMMFELRHETDLAILVSDGGEPVWLPKSQVEVEPAASPSGLVSVTLPEWLAEEKGLI